MTDDMMTFSVRANRIDAAGSLVEAKQTQLVIDTGMAGRPDALNPVKSGTKLSGTVTAALG